MKVFFVRHIQYTTGTIFCQHVFLFCVILNIFSQHESLFWVSQNTCATRIFVQHVQNVSIKNFVAKEKYMCSH